MSKFITVSIDALDKIITLLKNDTGPYPLPNEWYIDKLIESAKESCTYDEEGEGYTAPGCLEAGDRWMKTANILKTILKVWNQPYKKP